ncbi:Origin recognition complex subunit 2 family protein [Cryptosporidium felis]|nr:Origin recognition complex subunit 2 family protein [Cryptosporidium felis]
MAKTTFSDYLISDNSNAPFNEQLPEINFESLKENDLIAEELHKETIKTRGLTWRPKFDKILSWSLTGFNVLVYGLGSKKNFLDEFVQEKISQNYIALTIKGYYKQIKLRICLMELLRALMQYDDIQIEELRSSNSSNTECNIDSIISKIQVLYNNFSTYDKDIFVIIHNIDSYSIRPYITAISRLSQISFIKIVASADNIRWPLILSSSIRSKMNLLYMNVSTLEDYQTELQHMYGDKLHPWLNILTDEITEYKLDQLGSILNCLTPSHIQLTKTIATLQLEYGYASEDQLFKSLKSSMIVTTKNALSQLLIELFTHDILTRNYIDDGSAKNGNIIYQLKFPNELLEECLKI